MQPHLNHVHRSMVVVDGLDSAFYTEYGIMYMHVASDDFSPEATAIVQETKSLKNRSIY